MSKSSKKSSGRSLPHLLKMSPMADALASGPVTLPDVKAPSLEGLKVTVPARADLTEDDLLRRLHELKREHASMRDRAVGEQVALGDEVQLNTLGYCDGKLIPFSVRVGLWLELAPQAPLPGFAEAIAAGTVGDSLEVNLVLPSDYPVEWMRGLPARFVVDLKAAREVVELGDETPALFKALGRGTTLDAVMTSIREELEDELADSLTLEGQERVLDALVSRAKLTVPSTLVEEEIRRRWGQQEGKLLGELGFDAEEQREAMLGWLNDPATRADAEHRLQVALVLRAVAAQAHLELTPAKLEHIAQVAGAASGLSAEQVRAGLRESKDLTAQMAQTAWHLLAVEHVMAAAQVTYEGA